MRSLKQARSNFIRFKILDNPYLGKGKCTGGCRRNLSSFYWVWVSSKDGQKICMFCYADSLKFMLNGGRARVRKKSYGGMPKITPSWNTGKSLSNKLRLKYGGLMGQCSICPKDCKIPFSPNVTKFVCMEYNVAEAKRRTG